MGKTFLEVGKKKLLFWRSSCWIVSSRLMPLITSWLDCFNNFLHLLTSRPGWSQHCLTELQCQPPPWCHHTLRSGYHCCTNLNLVLIWEHTLSLTTAGCTWTAQVQSSDFSLNKSVVVMLSDSGSYPLPTWSQYCSAGFQVSSCNAEWLSSIANLRSILPWNQPTKTLLQVQIQQCSH